MRLTSMKKNKGSQDAVDETIEPGFIHEPLLSSRRTKKSGEEEEANLLESSFQGNRVIKRTMSDCLEIATSIDQASALSKYT